MGFCGIERVLWRFFFFFRVFQASKGKRGVSEERQTRTQRVSDPPRSPTPASCSPEKREKPNVVKRSRSCTVLEGWGISSFPAVVQWDVMGLPLPLSTAEGKLNDSADSILQSSGYARDPPSSLHNRRFKYEPSEVNAEFRAKRDLRETRN